MTADRNLVLSSTSIYRQQLLDQIQLNYQVASPTTDERAYHDSNPIHLAEKLSVLKAKSISSLYPNHLIIGADQVAMLGDEMMPKPMTRTTAVAQLRQVSGQSVAFHSGLCLYDSACDQTQVTTVTTIAHFRKLSDKMIEKYLDNESALNCGCSLKSEGLGIALLSAMETTDPTALIGLPLMKLTEFLEHAGCSVL